MYYVYVLRSKINESIYIGSTNNLKERFRLHNKGKVFYTKRYKPWELLYYEAYNEENLARMREKRLKHNGNAIKELKKRVGLLDIKKNKGVHPAPLFFRKKSGAGFTLIEMLVYVSIMAVVISVIAAFLPQVIRTGLYTQARALVLSNNRSAMEVIAHEIRHSNGVYAPTSVFGSNPGQLSLEMTTTTMADEAYTFSDFYVDDERLYIKREEQADILLMSEKIKVDSLVFTHLNTTSSNPGIRISLTTSYNTLSVDLQEQSKVTLTSTISLREY